MTIVDKSAKDIVTELRKSGSIGRILGKGSFSSVYEAAMPNAVYKLTTCDAYVDFILSAQKFVRHGDVHLPWMLRYDGIVGEDFDEGGIHGIWIERLRPCKRSDEQACRDKRFIRSQAYEETLIERFVSGKIRHRYRISDTLKDSLDHLLQICAGCGYSFDLHNDNMMVRPSDGRIVISDPICL